MTLLSELKRAITIDFETEPIRSRPEYPPKPSGVAIKYPGRKSVYITDKRKMKEAVCSAFLSTSPLLFHNAPFDVDVACTHLKAKLPDASRIHDTVLLLFLDDPHAQDYQLKPSAERLLGEAPEERDAIVDWLMDHQEELGLKLSRSRNSKKYDYAGAHVCKAPVDLVAPYACGDTDRTYKLAMMVGRRISKKQHMVAAYRREQSMLPVILEMERHGVRVNVRAIGRDIKMYEEFTVRIEKWLCRKLQERYGDINLDSGAELAEALIDAKLAKREDFGLTPSGQLCTNKDALEAAVKNPQITAALRWRGAVATCLKIFLRPWHEQAKKNNGRVFVRWNSTRRDSGGGARTGRLSSSPNLMNIPKQFKPLFSAFEPDLVRRKSLPKSPISGLPDVPRVRQYVLPDKGHVLIDRDFSSQELRVLAYFEADDIAQSFVEKPELDLHQRVADDLRIDRFAAKTINFAILYGVGNGHLAEMLGCSVKEAKQIKEDYFNAYPSVRELVSTLKKLGKEGIAIRTWGGREYLCEPPKWINGRMWDFSYKLLNYLIQGSSADQTKQCMIEFHEKKVRNVWILACVHDELLVSCPKASWKKTMFVLKRIMNQPRMDEVPMLSSGKVGSTFATMKACD